MHSQLVAIINLTPDSFSDGGMLPDSDTALARIRQCILHGADVIDIGAESTRPGTTPLTPDEEWKRLEPVLGAAIALCHAHGIRASLDTRHAQTAQRALMLGIDWINDVNGFRNSDMIKAVQPSQATLVVMHSLSIPADKTITLPEEEDPVQAVLAWGKHQLATLEEAGIARSRIIFDPGIGFGKTAEQSWALIHGIRSFETLGVPLLVGHSRKSFLSTITNKAFADRDAETLIVSKELIAAGVAYLRVHDVSGHKSASTSF